MDVEQLKDDVRRGRIDVDRLVELTATLQRQLQAAHRRIEELEKKLGGSPTAKVDQPFSVREEEKRQQARGKKRRKRNPPVRRGRITTADKIALAVRTEKVFPSGVAENDCRLSHTRPVWRLEKGQAVLVAYEVYRGPKNRYGKIPGVPGRGEFGMEIIVAIAYLVYVVGLSLDKVCLLLNFFSEPEAAKVAGRRLAASIVAAVGKRVRYPMRVAGPFGGGSLRRNELEHQQRVGVFIRESSRAVFRRS